MSVHFVSLHFDFRYCRVPPDEDDSMNIILPKTFVWENDIKGPLFFLGGPVKGGDDWQHEAARLLGERLGECTVAIPMRYQNKHPLLRLQLQGDDLMPFKRQLDWERHYMMEAAKNGCLLFWLPLESTTNPRPREDGPYAQDTYGELGRWSVRLEHNTELRMVIGAVEGFHGLDCIRRNISADLEREFPIQRTLEETVNAAIELLTPKAS
jgi:hypothetical protein